MESTSSPSTEKLPPSSSWPKVIGIVLLIFGIAGLLQVPLSLSSPEITETSITPFIEKGADPDDVALFIDDMRIYATVAAVLYAIAGVVMLVGAVFLLQKKKLARLVLLTWAVIKIAAGAYILYRGFYIADFRAEIMSAADPSTEDLMRGTAIMFSVMSFLWLLVLPVFILIWFSLSKIKSQIATW